MNGLIYYFFFFKCSFAIHIFTAYISTKAPSAPRRDVGHWGMIILHRVCVLLNPTRGILFRNLTIPIIRMFRTAIIEYTLVETNFWNKGQGTRLCQVLLLNMPTWHHQNCDVLAGARANAAVQSIDVLDNVGLRQICLYNLLLILFTIDSTKGENYAVIQLTVLNCLSTQTQDKIM